MWTKRVKRKMKELIAAHLKVMVQAGTWIGFFVGVAYVYGQQLFNKLANLESLAFIQQLADIMLTVIAFSIVSSTGFMLLTLVIFGSIGFILGLLKAE